MNDRTATLIDIFASLSPLREFSISPDGLSVAFVRELRGAGQIFSMPLENAGWPNRLTATLTACTEPNWSPDGKRLAFIRGKALWVMNADGTNAHALTEHPAGNASPRWSPDGKRIAFLSRRRGWDHIWTISPCGDALTQITLGAFDVADPQWSPDSRQLAFCSIREDDLSRRGVYLIRADGGNEQLISPGGRWSGAPCFSPHGQTLAYLSDHDGWFHVYLCDLRSGSTRPLTQGEYEDGGPHFYNIDPSGGPIYSPDGGQVAFIRHREGQFDLWIADVRSGQAHRISRDEGLYRIVGWLPDSKRIAVSHEKLAATNDLWLLSTNEQARQITDSSVAELKSPAMISPEWISYAARDGLTIHAALFRPRSQSKAPAVLFLHGGPNFEFGESYSPLPHILAREGYTVLAPNYRGSTGYGTAFRRANFGEWGHADALDAIDGVSWLKSQENVDPNRLAVAGSSYGGYLTLCALTLAPELFCAGVDLYGDSEISEAFRHGDRDARLDLMRQMGTPEDNPDGYRRGSPVYLAQRIQSPILILHGKDDMMVVPRMSEKMIEALRIENKYFESAFYEGEEHGFEKPENKKDAWQRIVNFLNRYCKEGV